MRSDDEVLLPGNVGGAVLVGDTVRRPTGPWTPAVHDLLRHLAGRLPGIPEVLGFDEQGREVLTYLPGEVIDVSREQLTPGQVSALAGWTRAFHRAVADFRHPGPWRFTPAGEPSLIGHNDIAPYNACFDGDRLAGVFDWDVAGPTTPLLELAFIAWNCVPLWRDIGAAQSAERVRLIATGYGGFAPGQVLAAVPGRIGAMLDTIPAAAAAGDQGMVNLMAAGEPGRSRRSLADLVARLPAISRCLE